MRGEVSPASTNLDEIAMPESTLRRFGLGDAMILTAGNAAGLAWIKYIHNSYPSYDRMWLNLPNLPRRVIWFTQSYDVYSILPVMIALLAIGLRRLEKDEILSRPGMMALLAGLAGVVGTVVSRAIEMQYLITIGSMPGYRDILSTPDFLTWAIWRHPALMGYSIALIWLYMRLSGRWEPRKDWLDRACRLIGFYWIVAAIVPPS